MGGDSLGYATLEDDPLDTHDYFAGTTLIDSSTGAPLRSMAFNAFLPTDASFSRQLEITGKDSGAVLDPFISSDTGAVPAFRVEGNPTHVVLVSGNATVAMSSVVGTIFDADLAPEVMEVVIEAALDRRSDDAGSPGWNFYPILSDTAPEQTTFDGLPVVWLRRSATPRPVPVQPQEPLWDDTNTTATIPPSMVGIEYQDAVSGQVFAPGLVVNGVKGQELQIRAVALPGYVMATTYLWKHRFLDSSKATLVASDTFSGSTSVSLINRTLDNALGGARTMVWRGTKMGIVPTWTPPYLDWRGGGYTGFGCSGASSLKQTYSAAEIAPTVTGSSPGGSLRAGTYYYMVTAVLAVGETGCANQKSVTVSGTTSKVDLSWPAVAGAASIRIWRGESSGGEKLLTTLPGSATSFTDTGSLAVGSQTPPYQGTGPNGVGLQLASPWQRLQFTLSGVVSSHGDVSVRFRAPSNWTIYFSGYSVSISYKQVRLTIGSDASDAKVADVVSFAHDGDVNGAWDVYIIGDTLTAVAPNGAVYSRSVKPFLASTSASDRTSGNGTVLTPGGSAVVTNMKVYEVGQ